MTLDVGQHLHTLRRAARRSPYRRACAALGWEEEDLLQELALRVHAGQRRSPYDARRADVATYLAGVAHRCMRDLVEQANSMRRGGGSRDAMRASLARGEAAPWPVREQTAARMPDQDDGADTFALGQWVLLLHRGEAWAWVVHLELSEWAHGNVPSNTLSHEAVEVVEAWANENGIPSHMVQRGLRA